MSFACTSSDPYFHLSGISFFWSANAVDVVRLHRLHRLSKRTYKNNVTYIKGAKGERRILSVQRREMLKLTDKKSITVLRLQPQSNCASIAPI